MSDSENLTAEQCNVLTQQFAEATGTDVMLAHYFLQEADWNLEKAVDDYYRHPEPDKTEEPSVHLSASVQPSNPTSSEVSTQTDGFSLLTWNLDGLDPHNRQSRTNASIQIIEKLAPDIVCVQEIVGDTFKLFDAKLSKVYSLHSGINSGLEQPYFCCILIKKSVQCLRQTVVKFSSSQMGRHIVSCKTMLPGNSEVHFMCTHLESCKDYSAERKKQLLDCFERMQAMDKTATVILSGDMNIRDSEVKAIGGLPTGITDAWELCNHPKEAQFTWDTLLNDNHEKPASEDQANEKAENKPQNSWKPRCRYDRVYIRNSVPISFKPTSFTLVGKERIRSALCFPSDHFGIFAKFIRVAK